MRLSVFLAPVRDTPDHIALAEQLGFARAWCYDSPLPYHDPFVTLARAADRTTRIGLGIGVLVPRLRTPVATAAGPPLRSARSWRSRFTRSANSHGASTASTPRCVPRPSATSGTSRRRSRRAGGTRSFTGGHLTEVLLEQDHAVVTPDNIQRFGFCGTAGDLARRVPDMERDGVTELAIQPGGDIPKELHRIAEALL